MKRLALLGLAALLTAVHADPNPEIEVTFGKFQGATSVQGRAALVERDGQRFLRFTWTKTPPAGLRFRLVKQESGKLGPVSPTQDFVDLGPRPARRPIAKDLDAWLYRTVVAIEPSSSRVVAFANLRSAQEAGRN